MHSSAFPPTIIGAISSLVHQWISLCLLLIKHSLFVWLHKLLSIILYFIPFGIQCSAEGRAFIYFTHFIEFIGVKSVITNQDVNIEVPSSHFEKMLVIRQKLVELFDKNLRLLYPKHTYDSQQLTITPLKLFDAKFFYGDEKSFFITTHSKEGPNSPIEEKRPSKVTILYFHGGGFLCGESTTYLNILLPWLYEYNLDCLLVDYGLCPHHSPEEIAVQGRIAYDYLINERSINPRNLFCAGESAGANLAIQVVRELVVEGNYDRLPAGLILLSPWVDLTLSTNSWKTSGTDMVLTDNMCRLGEKLEIFSREQSYQYSPIFADLSHLPPCLVSFGEQERLRDECELLCDRLRHFGVEVTRDPYKGMFHAFSLFHKYIPEGKMSLDKAASFIKQHVL
jgi:monoterpene epsilon-lactone hydrolase